MCSNGCIVRPWAEEGKTWIEDNAAAARPCGKLLFVPLDLASLASVKAGLYKLKAVDPWLARRLVSEK
jgi:hypothetical protein